MEIPVQLRDSHATLPTARPVTEPVTTTAPEPLPGMPIPPVPPAVQRAEDYETWLAAVRPAFEKAATSGTTFTAYDVARDNQLPEPPDTHQWGRLLSLLREEGWIRHAGWACSARPTTHASGVRQWRGTRAAMQGRAA